MTRLGYTPVNTDGMGDRMYCCDMESMIYKDRQVAEDIASELREENKNENIKVGVVFEADNVCNCMSDMFFHITAVSRDDVEQAMSKKVADSLSDDEMRLIADKMSKDYVEQLFWIHLPIIVEGVMEYRKK
jgi:hypothetical protein